MKTRHFGMTGLAVCTLILAFSVPSKGQILIPDSGFESPVVGISNAFFEYEPTSAAWTFVGTQSTGFSPGSGIAANGSNFTSGIPSAPQGSQVAFVQGAGSFSQALSGFTAGDTYTLTFQAAQRAEVDPDPAIAFTSPGADWNVLGQTWNVTIDGSTVQSFAPGESATSYQEYSTTFVATGSSETLAFVGTNLNGGDNTIFIDNVAINQSSAAPEPSTWALLLGGVGLLFFCRNRARRGGPFRGQPAGC